MSKERLVKLLEEAKTKALCTMGSLNNSFGAWYADHIIADGWIRPPCKVGAEVWINNEYGTLKARVTEITVISNDKFLVQIHFDLMYCYKAGINTFGRVGYTEDKFEFGKTVFLTREEAEAKLKEGNNEV